MHALWVHDHPFVRLQGGAVATSSGKLPASVWDRYLQVFGRLTVVGRDGGLTSEFSRAALSSRGCVRHVLLQEIQSPRGLISNLSAARSVIRQLVVDSEAVIVRMPSLFGEIAAVEAQSAGKMWAVEVVACPWDAYWNYGSIAGRLMAPRSYLSMRRVVRRAPFAIYVTEHFLQRRYPTKGIAASASNVELIEWDRSILAKRLRRPLPPAPVVGLIGGLTNEMKGHRTLLKAVALLSPKHPSLQVRLLGGGNTEGWQHLADRLGVGDRVVFDGTLRAGAEVNGWLDSLDLYTQPSFQEGLPRSLIEAMARGLPAIGSRVAGIPELLDDDLMHRPGDAGGLAERIDIFLSDKERRLQASVDNFARAGRYRREIVSKARHRFWAEFAEAVRIRNNITSSTEAAS